MTPDLTPPEAPGRDWCGGDPFETRFLEAMSLLAPEMERFLIASVRAGLARPGGERMTARGGAFMREEAAHSAAHHQLNRRIAAQGVDADAVLAGVRRLSARAQRGLSPGMQLAVSSACEHLSAIVSLSYLRSAGRSRIAVPELEELFASHARDEIAHRAVVFDLMRATGGGGWLARLLALTVVSGVAVFEAVHVVLALHAAEPSARRFGAWRQLLGGLRRIGRWGSMSAVLAHWMLYLQPGFHPHRLPER